MPRLQLHEGADYNVGHDVRSMRVPDTLLAEREAGPRLCTDYGGRSDPASQRQTGITNNSGSFATLAAGSGGARSGRRLD
jgi:hypothetical protein